MEISYYKPLELIAAEYNPRQLTKDQHKDLTDSIKRFGLVDPLIVNTHKDRMNVLVGGHQRLKIAQELDIKEIPCVEVELNPEQERELNIRLNKNSGEWDYDALANYFDVGELTEWGFTDDELQFYEDEPTEGLIDDDEVPEVEESITKLGDLWLLGEHRVLCGDATKKEDVERLMDGQKADMVFTDPPYGLDWSGGTWAKSSIYQKAKNWDNLVEKKEIDFIISLSSNVILWGGNYYSMPPSKCWLAWKKPSMPTMADFELAWTSFDKPTKIFESNRTPDGKKIHAAQKPVALAEWCYENFGNPKAVLDLFLGSGSTLIACEKTNRKCYGMEIDPHYCDVIVKRWEDYTGNKAERVERAES